MCASTMKLSSMFVCGQAFQSVFITSTAWGQFTQTCNPGLTSGTVTLSVAFGTQTLSVLNLNVAAKSAAVVVGAVSIPCTLTANGTTGISLSFTSAPTLTPGNVLSVILSA